jgi:DNA-binding NtrC family response regulator
MPSEKSKNNPINDIDYKKNNNNNNNDNTNRLDSSRSLIRQKDESNYDDKSLARLLIVDDDPDIVQILKLGLQQSRFLVEGFTDPIDALQSVKSNAESYYCLMLSDVRMPGLSGMQLARKVKEVRPNIKVVLMTAFEIKDEEFSKVFPSTQVDGLVQKPIGIKKLTDKILSLVCNTKIRK